MDQTKFETLKSKIKLDSSDSLYNKLSEYEIYYTKCACISMSKFIENKYCVKFTEKFWNDIENKFNNFYIYPDNFYVIKSYYNIPDMPIINNNFEIAYSLSEIFNEICEKIKTASSPNNLENTINYTFES